MGTPSFAVPSLERTVEAGAIDTLAAQRRRVGVNRQRRSRTVVAHAVNRRRREVKGLTGCKPPCDRRPAERKPLLGNGSLEHDDPRCRDVVIVKTRV